MRTEAEFPMASNVGVNSRLLGRRLNSSSKCQKCSGLTCFEKVGLWSKGEGGHHALARRQNMDRTLFERRTQRLLP